MYWKNKQILNFQRNWIHHFQYNISIFGSLTSALREHVSICLFYNIWDNSDIYVHQVYAFVAPKIIGGKNAPSPVGDLGMVEMSQAINLIDVCYEQVSQNWFAFPVEVLRTLPSSSNNIPLVYVIIVESITCIQGKNYGVSSIG